MKYGTRVEAQAKEARVLYYGRIGMDDRQFQIILTTILLARRVGLIYDEEIKNAALQAQRIEKVVNEFIRTTDCR